MQRKSNIKIISNYSEFYIRKAAARTKKDKAKGEAIELMITVQNFTIIIVFFL